MLHDDQRVPGVFKVFHDRVDAIHVAGVQADRRFIQHEKCIDEVGAEGGRQIDSLHFAARERSALPIQREVPESHVHEVDEASPDFRQNQSPGFVFDFGVQCIDKRLKSRDRQKHHVVQREPRERLVNLRGDSQKGRPHESFVGVFAVGARYSSVRSRAASDAPIHGVGF